jgi:hypothetical protein
VDLSDDVPARYWVLDRRRHSWGRCSICWQYFEEDDGPLPIELEEALCRGCASKRIDGHPVTPTYLTWLEEGDPRWWSNWFCNCEGCNAAKRIRDNSASS